MAWIESTLIQPVSAAVVAAGVDTSSSAAAAAGRGLVAAFTVASNAGAVARGYVRPAAAVAQLTQRPLGARGFAGLGVGRLGMYDDLWQLPVQQGQAQLAARLGALPPTPIAVYNAVKAALALNTNPYDAFVAFTIAHAPDNLKAVWTVDAYAVYKSIEALAAYACKQDYTAAAAWGLRFPYDLHQDLAGPKAGSAGKAVFFPGTDIVQSLIGATANYGLLLDYVYRALSVFVPAMAQVYVDNAQAALPPGVVAPEDVCLVNGPDTAALNMYTEWVMPGFPCAPAKLLHWVVAANTREFGGDRVATLDTLRQLMDNGALKATEAGVGVAVAKTNEEITALVAANVITDREIETLETVQKVLQVAALPVTGCLLAAKVVAKAAGAVLEGAIPWYVPVGIGAVVLTVGYFALRAVLR